MCSETPAARQHQGMSAHEGGLLQHPPSWKVGRIGGMKLDRTDGRQRGCILT